MFRWCQANRIILTSLTSLTCPKARKNQKPRNRQTPLKALAIFSPFHPFTFKRRQPFFHLFTLSPLKALAIFSPFHLFTSSPFLLFTLPSFSPSSMAESHLFATILSIERAVFIEQQVSVADGLHHSPTELLTLHRTPLALTLYTILRYSPRFAAAHDG